MRGRSWLAGSSAAAFAAVLIAACLTPTSMTVVVSTDVDCTQTDQRREAHVVVGTPESVLNELDAASTKPCEASGEVGEVVLLPRDEESAEVAFKVILGVDRETGACGIDGETEEEKWAGCIIARRRLSFIEGEALTVDVPLHADCIGVPCSEVAFTTCVAGGRCVPADVDEADCFDGCGEDDLEPTATSATSVTVGAGGGDGGSPPTATSATQGGGGEGGEGGAPPGCVDPASDCDAPAEECLRATCDDGACAVVPRDQGEPCGGGFFCDGEGRCATCLSAAQCPEMDCNVASCDDGECTYEPGAEGAECDDGTCHGGTCTAPPNCSNGTFDPLQGETDFNCGGPCGDCPVGDGCAIGEDCVTGFCDDVTCAFCDVDADCPVAQHCTDAGTCEPDLGVGGPCDPTDGGGECQSGICEEGGFCCATVCDGPCVECSSGTCEDRTVGSIAELGCPDDVCTNGCDGAGECDYESGGTICDQACASGVAVITTCDGAGSCSDTATSPCYPYLCEGAVCGDDCNKSSDCVVGATCSGNECKVACNGPADCPDPPDPCQVADCVQNQCVARAGNENDPCGAANECSPDGRYLYGAGFCFMGSCQRPQIDCAPYACENGSCRSSCDTDQDCSGGASCNAPFCGAGGTTASVSVSSSAVSSSVSTVSVAVSSSAVSSSVSTVSVAVSSSATGNTAATTTIATPSSADGGFASWSDGGAPPR